MRKKYLKIGIGVFCLAALLTIAVFVLQNTQMRTIDNSHIIEPLVCQERLELLDYEEMGERTIDTIIIHSSYNPEAQEPFAVESLLDIYKKYFVSTHYLIDREGILYRLVEEKNIAHHAGESSLPNGDIHINTRSLGIELIGDEESGFTSEQYAALQDLLQNIEARYDIKYILGHSDIAPERKTDPWNFNWDSIKKKL